MSAELLRHVTNERVNAKVAEYVEALTRVHDRPLDEIRLMQGKIAGLREAMEIQREAARGMG